jgi:hypothetical protein
MDHATPVHHGRPQVGQHPIMVDQSAPPTMERREGVLDDVLGGLLAPYQQERQTDQAKPVGREHLGHDDITRALSGQPPWWRWFRYHSLNLRWHTSSMHNPPSRLLRKAKLTFFTRP